MVNFSYGNSKLHELAKYLSLPKRAVVSFDLPAGYTCPMANKCKSYANRETGKITDGKDMVFRCYAASSEAAFTSVRKMRWNNFDALRGKSVNEMATLISESLPSGVKVVRIHSSGDFFSFDYFLAWMQVATLNPSITFFGYTKVLDYVNAPNPDNFRLVYSFGGLEDARVTNEPVCYVVASPDVAGSLPVACQANPSDDYDFVMAGLSFALALHGTQPKRVS